MKLARKLISVIVAGAFATSMLSVPAFADEDGEGSAYARDSYKVNVYGGNHGSVSAPTSAVAPGSTFSFDGITVTLSGDSADKYYVKGIRDASINNAYTGKFNVQPSQVQQAADSSAVYTVVGASPATITQDTDYVVAYGIKSQRVNYTVRYVDRAGEEIAEPDTYVGDIGDRPTPVAKYIEGYVPTSYRVSKELTANAADNVLTFEYTRLDPNYQIIQLPDGEYVIENIDGGTTVLPPVTETVPGTTPATPAAPGATDGADAADGATPLVDDAGNTVIDDDGNPLAAPVDEINLDDDETPLASGVGQNAEGTSQNPVSFLTWLLPVLAALVIAALAVFFALLIRNKRKDENQ